MAKHILLDSLHQEVTKLSIYPIVYWMPEMLLSIQTLLGSNLDFIKHRYIHYKITKMCCGNTGSGCYTAKMLLSAKILLGHTSGFRFGLRQNGLILACKMGIL